MKAKEGWLFLQLILWTLAIYGLGLYVGYHYALKEVCK